MDENCILFDWLSFVWKSDEATIEGAFELLGMDPVLFTKAKGSRWYSLCYRYDGISVFTANRDGRDSNEVFVDMSGAGCRAYETHGNGAWDDLFLRFQNKHEYNVTRLDIAFDDHTDIFDIETLFTETLTQSYVSRFRSWHVVKGSDGVSVNLGSEQSKIFFRFYDKAAERGYDPKEDGLHWVRFEIQLRDTNASQFIALLNDLPIGQAFAGVVNNYVRYVEPSRDSHRDRWPTAPFWERFIEDAEKLSLYVAPGSEYNFEKASTYLRQYGASAGAICRIMGQEDFLSILDNLLGVARNPKYMDLVQTEVTKKRGADRAQ